MISPEAICKLVEQCNTPYIMIYDMSRHKLHTIEDIHTSARTAEKLSTILPMYAAYGKIIVKAATEKQKQSTYKGAHEWICSFMGMPGQTGVAGMGMGSHMQYPMGAMPNGYIPNSVMDAKLDAIKAEMKHDREMDALKLQISNKDREDPIAIIEKLSAPLMYMMGKPINEINQISSLYTTNQFKTPGAAAPGAIAPAPGSIAGTPSGVKLTFSDVQKLPTEEKAKKLQLLLDELSKVVPRETMILLFDGLLTKTKANAQFPNTLLAYL